MRVAVATIGRFHSFDLARQLLARDALAAVFTGYPRFKLRGCGIPPERLHTFPWLQAPYMALAGRPWFQRSLEPAWARAARRSFDAYVAGRLAAGAVACDVISILSGFGLHAGPAAQARGARHVCDRASSHILTQDRLLAEEHERAGLRWPGIDPEAIARELAEYAHADAISIPSSFVRDSFLAHGVAADRLIQVPYGVALDRFHRRVPRDAEFRVLFVGALSVRKGLHDLAAAFRRAALPGATLVLAGGPTPHTEALLARHPVARLERLGHVSQERVAVEMSRASVLVLPSVEEGMATVMGQALACGCPVIATPNSGAPDLFSDGREGFIVPIRDPDAIADRLARLHADRALVAAMGAAAQARAAGLGGWDDYGRRMLAAFARLL